MDDPTRHRPAHDRDRALRRLHRLTLGTAIAGSVGALAFAGLAAATYDGAATTPTTIDATSGTSGTSGASGATTTDTNPSDSSSSTGGLRSAASAPSTSSGGGQVSTGGSG